MQFDKGYISPYFVTDPERMEAVLEDAYVLCVNKKSTSLLTLFLSSNRLLVTDVLC